MFIDLQKSKVIFTKVVSLTHSMKILNGVLATEKLVLDLLNDVKLSIERMDTFIEE